MHDIKRIAQDPGALVDELKGFVEPVVDNKRNESPLDRALWLCNFCLSTAKFQEHDEQTIWLFTNDDDPHRNNAILKLKLEKRFEVCTLSQCIDYRLIV